MFKTLRWRILPAAIGAGVLLLALAAPAVGIFPSGYVIRLETALHGLDVEVRTAASVAAIARLENRTDHNVFCSVGFYHGLDLRKRTSHELEPGESRLYTYPVRQRVGAVPVEVVCDTRRGALPRDYLS